MDNVTSHQMTTSPPLSFMDLPLEIRTQIYKLLFGGIDTVSTLKFLIRGSHLPITAFVHGHSTWRIDEICSGVPPDCTGDKSDGAKHPSEVMLSLLMTSTRIQNEALPFALPDMKLCVDGVRGSRGWSAVIQDSNSRTPIIGARLFVPARETADCSCFPLVCNAAPLERKLVVEISQDSNLECGFPGKLENHNHNLLQRPRKC
jgi:hypothetical protein